MKNIPFDAVVSAVRNLAMRAATRLPDDIGRALADARAGERSPLACSFLDQCLENAAIARNEEMPICQDTGFAVYFIELGEACRVEGGSLRDAVNEGTRRGYRDGYLRKSIVRDPIFGRVNTGDNTPAVIHLEIVPGEQLHITLAPKGGGSENMSRVALLKPSQGRAGVVDFVVETLRIAGGNPCPPTIVGVGVGGTMEIAALLAKKALLTPTGERHPNADYAALEVELLDRINHLNVGPQGLGGDTTSLDVHILYHPCHIASLPVAVNLNCHAARHAEVTL